ncbi:MAG TPA: hypothetical protein DIC60_00960 [Lachnospiraceae bacterium]|nr:hypothetical protein [Lachnospiraceae bacterium]
MRKKTLIKGAAILMCANLITRFMGFYYRIYMSKAIGAEGMGLYQLIMPIYMLAWSITSSGLTTTVSKLTAQENAKREFGNTSRILHISLFISLVLSLCLSIALFVFSDFAAIHIIKDARTSLPLRILSLAFPFMSLGSCIRGNFLGMQRHFFPAVSQVLEQSVRIIAIFALSDLFIPLGLEYACGAAVVGIVLGEIISFILIFFSMKYVHTSLPSKKPTISLMIAFSAICTMAVPLTLGRVTGSLLSTVENILIPQRLAIFSGGQNALSTFGSLTGMAMPLIQLPSAVLMAISVTLVPALSESQATNNSRQTASLIEKSITYTAVIGFGFAAVFAAFPQEICYIVYNEKELGSLLLRLCIICPFMYMQITISGILNGLGSHSFIFRQNLISSAINLFFIYLFIPHFGTDAFIAGITISLVLTTTMGIMEINKKSHSQFSPYKSIILPAICAVSAYIFLQFAPKNTTSNVYIVSLSAILLFLIYFILLFLTGAINKKDIMSFMPKRR